jgi:surfactin synthase thioesterase subunit
MTMSQQIHATTLFCFPCAGASAATYNKWRKLVPPWIRIEPVELPGRGARVVEAPIDDFDRLVATLTHELSTRLPANYAFFGHSMGALLAYGCAGALAKRRKDIPRAILVACCSAPTRRDNDRFSRAQSDDDLIQELKNLQGTPADVFEHAELLEMTLRTLRADYRVCESFRRRDAGPLASKIHVFGGRDDDVLEGDLAAWASEASGRITLEMFDGGHFFFRDCENFFLSRLVSKLGEQ